MAHQNELIVYPNLKDVMASTDFDSIKNHDNVTELVVEKVNISYVNYEQYDLSHQLITQFKEAILEDEPYTKRLDILIQFNFFTKTCEEPKLLGFIIEELCRQVHGSTYDYSPELKSFDIFHNKINIYCRQHGLFQLLLIDHLLPERTEVMNFNVYKNAPMGCLECRQYAIANNANRRLTSAMFIMRAERQLQLTTDYRYINYGSVFDIKDSNAEPSDRKIPIICNNCLKDGKLVVFIQRPYIHLRSSLKVGNGCSICCMKTRMTNARKLWDNPEFAKMKCAHAKEQASDPEFKKRMSVAMKLRVNTPEFRERMLSDETIEKRRIACAQFDPSKPADTYVLRGPELEHGIAIKIGHSSNLGGRISNFRCGTGYEFVPVWTRHFEDGLKSAELEELILNHEIIKPKLWDTKNGLIVRKGSSEILFVKDENEFNTIIDIVHEISGNFI